MDNFFQPFKLHEMILEESRGQLQENLRQISLDDGYFCPLRGQFRLKKANSEKLKSPNSILSDVRFRYFLDVIRSNL